MTALTRELADRLIADCDKYPYHELIAYANGTTIGDLTDWLERGAVVAEKERDPQKQELRRFTREYSRADAVFGRKMFQRMIATDTESAQAQGTENKAAWRNSHFRASLWDWFEKRWPCGTPVAIGTVLSGQRVEQLALDEALDNPNAEVGAALERTGYFRGDDLVEPSEKLRRLLAAAGWTRDAESEPHSPQKGE